MTAKIQRLSEVTINQIAAGEVIEHPASVVKELVDNALDAGAKSVKVEILGGGLQMIRITDDGSGMGRDDALLCIERHATSKIVDAADIFKIQTMGFRGEAIASIASISKMTLTTSLDEIGVRLEIDAGRIVSIDPHPRNRGTTIEVRHLFFNTPGRRKFQKSPASCASEVTRMLTTLALGYPHVAFSLYNHGQEVFTLQAHAAEAFATAISQRARDLLAENFQKDVITVDERDGSIHLQGLIGLPSNTRHTRQGGYLFINARPVVCPAISFAIRDGYGTRIAPDRHPVFVLSLTIPSHLLDVNVHPQKKEVRLSDESAIKQVVQRAISSALDQSMHKEPFYIEPPVFSDFCFEKFEGPSHDAIEKAPRQFYMAQVKAPIEQIDFSFPLDDVHVIGFWGSFLLVDALSLADKGPVKMDSGLCLVDLSAAKARIAFENLLKVKEHPIKGQKIMFPFSMQMGLSEISSLISSIDLLDKMGFGIAQTAPRSLIVDALPPDMDENAAKEALIEMAELSITLDREGGNELEGKRVRAFAKIALRYGKNSANISSAANGREILKALFQTSSPYFCPEGKKTIVYLSERDVQNYFR